jgi:hypothetical protein
MTPKKLFRLFALAEAVTWTLLIGGLILRATVGVPSMAYGVIASLTGVNQRWGLGRTVLAVALAIVPYATIPFELYVQRSGKLEGDWRREHSGDARDDHWFDRLDRWFIIRPALLTIVMFAVVTAIFAVLLMAGPPGGWPTND